jgi:hypothetical protein
MSTATSYWPFNTTEWVMESVLLTLLFMLGWTWGREYDANRNKQHAGSGVIFIKNRDGWPDGT